MKQVSIKSARKEDLAQYLDENMAMISELKTDGALVRVYENGITGEKIVSIDASGDDVILAM
jgi:hypothetical protein